MSTSRHSGRISRALTFGSGFALAMWLTVIPVPMASAADDGTEIGVDAQSGENTPGAAGQVDGDGDSDVPGGSGVDEETAGDSGNDNPGEDAEPSDPNAGGDDPDPDSPGEPALGPADDSGEQRGAAPGGEPGHSPADPPDSAADSGAAIEPDRATSQGAVPIPADRALEPLAGPPAPTQAAAPSPVSIAECRPSPGRITMASSASDRVVTYRVTMVDFWDDIPLYSQRVDAITAGTSQIFTHNVTEYDYAVLTCAVDDATTGESLASTTRLMDISSTTGGTIVWRELARGCPPGPLVVGVEYPDPKPAWTQVNYVATLAWENPEGKEIIMAESVYSGPVKDAPSTLIASVGAPISDGTWWFYYSRYGSSGGGPSGGLDTFAFDVTTNCPLVEQADISANLSCDAHGQAIMDVDIDNSGPSYRGILAFGEARIEAEVGTEATAHLSMNTGRSAITEKDRAALTAVTEDGQVATEFAPGSITCTPPDAPPEPPDPPIPDARSPQSGDAIVVELSPLQGRQAPPERSLGESRPTHLAKTGADIGLLVGIGTMMVLFGARLVVGRRRKRSG